MLLLNLLSALETFGFSLYASVDDTSDDNGADLLVVHRVIGCRGRSSSIGDGAVAGWTVPG